MLSNKASLLKHETGQVFAPVVGKIYRFVNLINMNKDVTDYDMTGFICSKLHEFYVFNAVSKAPLKENLDTASLNFGAEIDRHNGQLDAI